MTLLLETMIRIFEVGPRDGLQDEQRIAPTERKLALIRKLLEAGLRDIEIGAFVRADRVPQMADTPELFQSAELAELQACYPDAKFWALVPNEKGFDRALAAGARHIAVFSGATDSFVKANINMTVDESLKVFETIVRRAHGEGMDVRGYVSVCWLCPYEGPVPEQAVVRVVRPMLEMGIESLSLGETIGRAHPVQVESLLTRLFEFAPPSRFAVHFHDTYGLAVVNIDRSIRLGIRVVDGSIGGLGGCPYAPGAAGNVTTEDVYMLLKGYRSTDIAVQQLDDEKLLQASRIAQRMAGKRLPSRRLAAYTGQE